MKDYEEPLSTSALAWPSRERLIGPAPAILALGAAAAVVVVQLPLAAAGVVVLACLVVAWVAAEPAAGLLFVVVAVPFGSDYSIRVGGASVGATEALVWLVLASWLMSMVAHREVRLNASWLSVSVSVLVAGMLLSLPSASSLGPGIKEITKWIEMLGLLLATAQLMNTRWLNALIATTLLTGAVAAGQGIYQFLFQKGPEAFLLFDRFMRAYGTFAQPNPYAGYLGLGAALAFGVAAGCLFGPGERWRTRFIWLSMALTAGLLMLVAIVMSWSRGSWLGLAAGVGTMMVASIRWRRRMHLIGSVVPVAAVVLSIVSLSGVPGAISSRMTGLAFPRVQDVLGAEVTDANFSVLERLAHWQAAVAMWRDHFWLGVGIGNYAVAYPRYALPIWDDALGHAHNYYLNIAAEAGLIGLLAFLQVWTAAMVGAWRAITGPHGRFAGVSLGILGALVYLGAHSLFDSLFVHGIYLQVAILLGLVSYLAREGG